MEGCVFCLRFRLDKLLDFIDLSQSSFIAAAKKFVILERRAVWGRLLGSMATQGRFESVGCCFCWSHLFGLLFHSGLAASNARIGTFGILYIHNHAKGDFRWTTLRNPCRESRFDRYSKRGSISINRLQSFFIIIFWN